jgi:hypothetical protein
MVKHILLPNGSKMSSLHRKVVGSGYGAVLLDGGMGGQSSYSSLDDYYATTNQPRQIKTKGQGLADKITSKLKNLNIAPPTSKPKMKNITLSI